MSHSVFRDFDDEKLNETSSKDEIEIADQNLIVFINKDGGVTVDQSALQDLIVNANTEKKTTVSVIRLGSPTPSMESEKSVQSDADEAGENSDATNVSEQEESEESSGGSDDDESVATKSTGKRRKQKKKKNKNTVPSISMTVENFYNPEQAVVLAEEIMSIAGITNPKQLKADCEYLRYVIENDHCYTPLTSADAPGQTTITSTSSSMSTTTKVASSTKKLVGGRQAQASNKSNRTSSTDKELASGRLRSCDDANSSIENSGDRSSEAEEEQSESDYSDFSVSESDNDRDSDLDFSVNDLHSRRTRKKRNKRNATKQAKKLTKKQQRENAENTPDAAASEDASTPTNRKKGNNKLPKKQSNAKASPSTPATAPRPVGRPATIKKETNDEASSSSSSSAAAVKQTAKAASRHEDVASNEVETANKAKPVIVVAKAKEKKTNDALFTDMSSLFSTPDIIKKVVDTDAPKMKSSGGSVYTTILGSDQSRRGQQPQHQIRYNVRNVKLASEQDKQLELIDSLVQEELSKDSTSSTKSSTMITAKGAVDSQSQIPNIVKMLETPPSASANPFASISHAIDAGVASTFASVESKEAKKQKKTAEEEKQLLDADDLLEGFANSDDYLTEDLLQHVAQLVKDKNLQEVIDQQVLGLDTPATTSTIVSPLPKVGSGATRTPKVGNVGILNAKTPVTNDRTPKANAASPVITTPINVSKEPIKIVRSDGRVITLPPIEAPTTRGAKRRAENPSVAGQQQQKQRVLLNSLMETTPVTDASANTIATLDKSGNIIAITGGADKMSNVPKERRASVSVAKRASIDTPKRKMSVSLPVTAPISVDDDDYDDDDGSDGSYNSEDDPLRLWCICRQPHNNRFMICCDKCEDWFHGKCVNITKQMGTEMEQRGAEWVCPNCIKKQQPSIKNIFPRKASSFDGKSGKSDTSTSLVVVENEQSQQSTSNTQNCLVCKKPARENSIYCSDDCIRKHANKTSTPSHTASTDNIRVASQSESKQPLKSPPATHQPPRILNALPVAKNKPGVPVIYDKKTNKFVSLNPVPTMEKLQKWLKMHPECELVRSNTPQWAAWKAKQSQLKNVAKGLEAEREANAASQPPAKVQTTLRFDADKKMILVNPMAKQSPTGNPKKTTTTATPTTKTPPANRLKRAADATTTPSTAAPKKRAEDPKSSKSSPKPGSDSGEPIRVNVRNTLSEHLKIRTRETESATATKKLSDDEINEFVTSTEASLYKMFGGVNNKYRAKYRSLIFNIKDRKNETLFTKISNKAIQPEQLVRMSPEELASQELAKWRENENKHQLEMITKSELDMLACARSYVLKTHKGEEVIETSGERVVLDPSIGAADVVSVLNSATVSSTSEAFDIIEATSTVAEKATHPIVKDNRYDKYLGASDSKSSVKKSSERSKSRDRHDSSRSSSKHKRKRSRERSHRDRDRDEKRHKSHDRDRSRERDRKDRGSDGKRDKHKSSSSSSGGGNGNSSGKSKHHDTDSKDRKREKDTDRLAQPTPAMKLPKSTESSDLSTKIDEAQSIIDRIVHPAEEAKQPQKVTTKEVPSTNTTVAIATSEPSATNTTKSQPNPVASNESDQEPTSTVTIPTPPEYATETAGKTDASPILWSGSISMIDVATFDISLSAIDGDPSHLVFPNELDVVGRIIPETVYDYISKIKVTKEIVLLRFSPTTDDDEAAYMAFMHYLEHRRRLGVLQTKCRAIKDFYILPLPAHKSLPSVLLPSDGRPVDLGADRGDLLIGIVVKTRSTAPSNRRLGVPNKVPKPNLSTASASTFSGIKISSSRASNNIPLLKPAHPDDHYTPPSSPKAPQKSTKAILQSTFSLGIEDGEEPYSPEDDSDDGVPSHLLPAIKNAVPTKTAAPGVDPDKIKREMEELNRQIEAEKMEIALLHTADIDEPYSPSNSVSPPLVDSQNSNNIPALANISIPANLADILKSIKSTAPTSTVPSMTTTNYDPNTLIVGSSVHVTPNYTTISGHITNEYVPPSTVPSYVDILGASTSEYTTPSTMQSEQPSKLAQLTDEELLRLVPDDSLLDFGVMPTPPSKKSKYDLEPAPPGIDGDDDEYCP